MQHLLIDSYMNETGTNLKVTFPADAGVIYRLEESVSLEAGSWQVIDEIEGRGAAESVSLPKEGQQAYFRVRPR